MDQSFKLSKRWDNILFQEYPKLFLPFLQIEEKKGLNDAIGINKILKENHIIKGSKILDFSCGIGRLSFNLSKMGYEVVGYDPSPLYIEIAKKRIKKFFKLSKRIQFYQGDSYQASKVLLNNNENNFNVIIIMSNSFGYSTEKNDNKMLKDLLDVATNGCILIMETENRDWRIRNFQPHINYVFKSMEVHEIWNFNFETSIAEAISKFYKKDKKGECLKLLLNLHSTIRLYSIHEMREKMNSNGWEFIKCFGDIVKLNQPNFDSELIVTIGKKF